MLEQLANDGEASNFLEMVYTAGLNETLEALGPVTLFAPNNQAFGRLTEDLVKNMRADNQLLLTVLENHIVMGKRIILGDLEDEELMLTTIGGRSLRINVYKKSKFYRVSKVVCHLQQKKGPSHLINWSLRTFTRPGPAVSNLFPWNRPKTIHLYLRYPRDF